MQPFPLNLKRQTSELRQVETGEFSWKRMEEKKKSRKSVLCLFSSSTLHLPFPFL